MIVISEARAVHIEKTAAEVLSKDPRKWKEYTTETLKDQQKLYLEALNEFDNIPFEKIPQKAHDIFFDICVYLAIFRTLLCAKRIGLPPIPLLIVK